MQQISPPLRIALVAILALAAIWFVALRPKGADSEPAAVTAPGAQGLGNGIAKARGAKEASDASAARTEQAVAGVEGSTAAAGTASKSASKAAAKAPKPATSGIETADVSGPARPLVAALNDGKVVVLLFASKSADSLHVSRVVRGVDKRDGGVVARVASAKDVGRYSVFTGKTSVGQAPTTFIVGPTGKAKVIAGYTSTGEVDQAIGDVLGRRSGSDRFGKGRGRDRKTS